MPDSKFLTQLNLSPDQRLNPPKVIGRLKTIQEWASSAVEALKDNNDFLAAIHAVFPWAEAAFSAAKDSLAPVKFVVKVFEELTKVQDPEELARLACTLAYQSAAEKAIATAGTPSHPAVAKLQFADESSEQTDFSSFTLNQILTQPFVAHADRILRYHLPFVGFSEGQTDQIVRDIHEDLPGIFNTLVSDGKSKEKFDPLFRWLQLPPEGRLSRASLRRHAKFTVCFR